MKDQKKKSILTLPLLLVFVPAVALSLFFSFFASRNVYIGKTESNRTELKNTCSYAVREYEKLGVSDELKTVFNEVSSVTNIHLAIIKNDQEVLSTTAASKTVKPDPLDLQAVIDTKEERFIVNIVFENESYSAYCIPIVENDTAVGVIYSFENVESVNISMRSTIIVINAISWTTTIAVGTFAFIRFNKMKKDLQSTVDYLSSISHGKPGIEIDERLINRKDEIGDVGKAAKKMKESIEQLVNYDSLTGLLNRRATEEYLKGVVAEDASNIYVALGDLDKFKAINDTYGHAAGDLVLKEVSKIFLEITDGTGIASRWGGEEYLFVFNGTDEQKITDLLNEIISRVRIHKFDYEGNTFDISISIGLSKYVDNIDRLIVDADKKMYKAKELGGGVLVK